MRIDRQGGSAEECLQRASMPRDCHMSHAPGAAIGMLRSPSRSLRVVIAVVTLTIGLASTAGAGPVSDPCRQASDLAKAHRIDRAFALYQGKAKACPGAAKATQELQRQRRRRDVDLAAASDALAASKASGISGDDAAGEIERARQAYERALAADADSKKARDGLSAIKDPFAGSRALLAAGLKGNALDQLKKELGAGHTLTQSHADTRLRNLTDPYPHWWDKWRAYARDIIEWLLIGLIAVLIVLLLLNLVWFERRRRAQKRRKYLDPNASWGRTRRRWRAFTQPRLNIVAGDGDTAKMLALQVRAAVRRIDTANGAEQIRFADVPEQSLDLADLGDIDARLKPIIAAFKLIARHDTVTATVSTSTDDKTHLRVGAEIVARKARASPPRPGGSFRPSGATTTFRSEVAADTTRAPEQVGQVVGWLLFNADEMRNRLREGPGSVEVYGTDDQPSFSAYLGGLEAIRSGQLESARKLFSQSLNHDDHNLRAQLNLAALELIDDDSRIRDTGLARLRALIPTTP